MVKRSAELLLTVPLVAATGALFWLVPDSPLRHLDDPIYWAILAYGCLLLTLAGLRLSRRPGSGRRRERVVLAIFLGAMPLVYLASAARLGAAAAWWALEAFGLVLYTGLATWSLTTAWLLPVGLLAHGIWDLAHHQRTPFLADWYAVACAVVDLGVCIYATQMVRDCVVAS